MRLRFEVPFAEADVGYKQGQEYDFMDTRKAHRFIDGGIAVPVEQVLTTLGRPEAAPPRKGKAEGKAGKHEVDAKLPHA